MAEMGATPIASREGANADANATAAPATIPESAAPSVISTLAGRLLAYSEFMVSAIKPTAPSARMRPESGSAISSM